MTTLANDLRVGVRIGTATVRDRFRRHTSSRRKKAFFGLVAVFSLPWIVLFLRQAYLLGVATRAGVDAPVVAIARNLFVPSVLVLAVIGGLEAVQQLGSDSIRSLLLTSTPTRAIVLGKVFSLLVSWLLLFVVGLGVVLAYAAGAHAPFFPIAVLLAIIPVFVLVLLVGLTVGYSLWLGVERLGLSEGSRQLLTAGLYVTIMVGMFGVGSLVGGTTAADGLGGLFPTGDPLVWLGWYADLFFLGSPMSSAIGIRTVLAAASILAAVPACFAVVVRLAPRYWYATPEQSEDPSDQSRSVGSGSKPSETVGRGAGPLSARFPTLRVARSYLRSARRQPDQFVYLFYYLFPVAPVVVQQVVGSSGAFSLTAGASLLVLGGWLAGGVFCLNPLGSEGAMLSQIVLAKRPAESFVHARLLLGSTLGISLSVVGIGLVTVATDRITPAIGLLGAALVGVTAVVSAGVALALGSVLPKFESVEIFESVETVAPSLVAAVIHAVVAILLLAGGAGVTLAAGHPASPLSVPARIGAVAGLLAVAGITTDASRRYASARLRDYGRESVRTGRPFAVYFSLGLAALALFLGQALALFAAFVVGFETPVGRLIPILFVVEYLGYVLVGVAFLYVSRRGFEYLDFSWPTPREVGIAFAGLLATLVIWGGASAVISGLGLPVAEHALFDPGEDGSPTLLLLLVPLLLLVNGPVEEFLYRNVIQKYLSERFPATVAISIASGIFALSHVPAYLTAGLGPLAVTLVLLFVVSWFWGFVYARTGSLFVVSAIHGLYNAALVFGLYLTIT